MSGKTVEGKVEILKHVWKDGSLQTSYLFIRTGNIGSSYHIRALVPDLVLGKQVVLYEEKSNGRLFQKLTLHLDKDKEYQVSSNTLV